MKSPLVALRIGESKLELLRSRVKGRAKGLSDYLRKLQDKGLEVELREEKKRAQ